MRNLKSSHKMKFTDTTSTTTLIAQGSTSAIFIAFLNSTLIEMIPYLVVAFVLIITDLKFGVQAARKRGEDIRASRAIRRTAGKAFEYFCWITIASTLTVAFDIKFIEYAILGLVMGIEIMSIVANWLFVHNKVIKGLNIFKIIGEKAGVDLSEVKIEEIKEDKNGINK